MKRLLLLLALCLMMVLAACAEESDDGTTPPEADADPTPTREVANVGAQAASAETQELVLATTTSTDDSGLLDAILPDFEAQFNADVSVVAVGTGQALELGANGDADVVLVHARAREDAFVDAGSGTARFDVMFNDFVIIGPADDPAGISGMDDAAAAFTALAENEAIFVSRGDDSGTHTKELAIWEAAGIAPDGNWYQEAGQGMGAVLTIADEQQGYTLTDRGTYIARSAVRLELDVLVEGDPILANPYGVIPVNPQQHDNVNFELAMQFVDWLTSVETQRMIGEFTVEGQQLFFPDSTQWREAQDQG